MLDNDESDLLDNDKQPVPGPRKNVLGKGTLTVAAILLALPALVPLLVLIDPSLVPFVGPVDSQDTGMIAFLIGFSALLLLVNWGFLFLIHRWLNNLANEEA